MAITKVTSGVRTLGTGEVTASDIESSLDLSSKTVTLPASSVTAHVSDFDDSGLQDDIAILGFKVAANGSLSKYNLADQVIDDFKDLTGCDTASSTNEYLNDTTAGAEFVYGGVSSGWVVKTPTANTTSSAGGHGGSALTNQLHDGNWDNIWDIADGNSWSGVWMKDDLGSAFVIRRCRYKIGNGTGTYEVYGSNDASDWTSMGTSSSGSFSATNGLVFEFTGNNTAYRYWRATVRSQTANTSSGDPKELEWSTQDVDISDLTFISTSTTADSAPTTGDLVMTYTNGAGTATVNTDLKAYVSRDNGTTWTQATLSSEGTTGGHTILTAHNVDISSQPSGTSMRYKIETLNQSASKETRIQAVSLGWA